MSRGERWFQRVSLVCLLLVGGYLLAPAEAQVRIQRGFNTVSGGFTLLTGVLQLPDGLVSAPSLTFDGDTNTGLYQSFDGYLSVSVNGSNVVSINGAAMELGDAYPLAWVTTPGGAANLALGRAAAGVAEITIGSTGNYRDLRMRAVVADSQVLIGGVAATSSVALLTPVLSASNRSNGIIIQQADGTAALFADLNGSATNGAMIYCSDCTFANPCAGSGTGAIAKRLNGAWRCD